VGAIRVARENPGAKIVCILCDGAEKYLSERFWDEV
jgi:cysteine synthase